MKMYVESSDHYASSTSAGKQILVDFENLSDAEEVERLIGVEPNTQKMSSMFSLDRKCFGNVIPRAGSWYDCSDAFFKQFSHAPINEGMAGDSYQRALLSVRTEGTNFDQPFLVKPVYAKLSLQDSTDSQLAEKLNCPREGGLKLRVRNCGQGNWNEIVSKTWRIVYDLGASRHYTYSQLKNLVISRGWGTSKEKVDVFISHWDIDHYQAILGFNKNDLLTVRSFTVPSQIPNTATFKRCSSIIANAGISICPISPAKRPVGSGRKIVLVKQWKSGPITIFRATSGSSRNQTGIVLMAKGENRVGLLTGDHHYPKLLSAIKGHADSDSIVFVVPHHGGAAGKLDVSDWNNEFSSIASALSVGTNSYGHPRKDILRDLNALNSAQLCRTDLCGDLVFYL